MILRNVRADLYRCCGNIVEINWSRPLPRKKNPLHRSRHSELSLCSAAESLLEIGESLDRPTQELQFHESTSMGLHADQTTCEEAITKMVESGKYDAAIQYFFELTTRGLSLSKRVVNCMINCFSKSENLSNARCLFNTSVASGRLPCKEACEDFVVELCRQKMFLEAFNLVNSINGDVLRCCFRTHKILIYELCANGFFVQAKELLSSYIEGRPPPYQVINLYKSLFYGLCKKGLIFGGKSVIVEMERNGYFVDKVMYTSLINLCCKRKKIKYAMQIYLRMVKVGCVPDAYTLRTIIHGFVDVGLFKKAWDLCNKLDETDQFDDIAYHFLMAKFCKQGKVDCAKAVLTLMNRQNVPPNLYHYTCLLKALLQRNEVSEAEALYRHMVDGNVVPDHILFFIFLRNTPNTKVLELTLLMLSSILCKGTHGPILHQTSHLSIEMLLEELVRRDLNLANIGYAVYITALCKLQRLDEALQCLRKSIECQLKPLLFTFNSIISCLCSKGLCNDVECLIEIMQEQSIFPDMGSYIVRIKEHCKRRNSEAAMSLFREMESNSMQPNVVIYNLIISCLCREHKVSQAESFFDEMISKNITPGEELYTTMINGYFMSGLPTKALFLLEKMKEKSVSRSSFSYTTAITGLVHCQMTNKACAYTRMMLEDGFSPNIVLFTSLINHFLKKRNVNVALRLYELVGRNNLQPDVRFYGNLVTSVCRLIAKTKHQKYTHAPDTHIERLLFLLHDKGRIWSPKTTHTRDDLKAFLRILLERIEDGDFLWSSYLHNVMILGFCWCERIENAYTQLEAMLKDGFPPNSVTFSILSNAHIRRREMNVSIELFNNMGALEMEPDLKNHNGLFMGFCKAGKPRDALCVMCLMYKRGYLPNKKVSHKLLHCLCACGDLGTAVNALEDMVRDGYVPRKFLVTWLSSCWKENCIDEAFRLRFPNMVINFVG